MVAAPADEGPVRFAEVTAAAGPAFALSESSRGAAFGDVDDDGDVDVVVTNNDGPVRLLVDQVGNGGAWVGLRLVTGAPRRDALGARVDAAARGGRAPLGAGGHRRQLRFGERSAAALRAGRRRGR